MCRSRFVFVLALAVLAVPAAAIAQEDLSSSPLWKQDVPAGFERVLRDYERAWAAGDEAALAALFTEDGKVRGDGIDVVAQGRAAIQAYYANAEGPLWLHPITFSPLEAGDTTAYVNGVYGYRNVHPTRHMGRFIMSLHRRPGGPWMIQG